MADWYEKSTLGELPARAAARWGEREALCFVNSDATIHRFTFAELSAEVERAAKALLSLGVEPGERVGLWLSNSPEWVFLMFALAKVGAVQIPINTRLRSSEIGYVLTQSGSGTLLTSGGGPVDLLAVLEGWQPSLREQRPGALELAEAPSLKRVVAVKGGARGGSHGKAVQDWAAALEAGAEISDGALAERADAVHPDGRLFIMYTSGTTGFPKGVVHTHNILRNVEDRANRMEITTTDVVLIFVPLFHIFGYGEGPISSLMTGARLVLTEAFNPAQCLELIEAERVSVTYGFDTHFQDLLAAQAAHPRRMETLRTAFVVAGMHSSTRTARQANAVFCPTVTGFGMTEVYVGAALSFPTASLEQRTETSGYPAPGYEFRVIDPESGRDCPVGTPGEILVRGYGLMEGYYEQPEETASTIDGEGWLHSGDMGLLREDGYLRFIGRYKDMLKVGGENVDPMEVESFLTAHPAIAQAAVVGTPDPRLGEVPVAFVIPGGGEAIEPADVLAHCKGRIAAFKTPRHVLLVEDFPMTSSGKVRKAELREQALAALGKPPVPGG